MVFEKIKSIVADQLGINEDEIKLESSFQDDLGADSLDLTELVMELEEHFNITVDNVEELKTVGDVVKFVEAQA